MVNMFGFAISGQEQQIILRICILELTIKNCRLAHPGNFQICDCGISPKICGFTICVPTFGRYQRYYSYLQRVYSTVLRFMLYHKTPLHCCSSDIGREGLTFILGRGCGWVKGPVRGVGEGGIGE